MAGIAAVLGAVGYRCDIESDALIVHPERDSAVEPAVVESRHGGAADHRLAMLGALLALRTPGTRIADPWCVDKSWPGFFEDLEAICVR